MIQADSDNEDSPQDLHKELQELEARLGEEPSNRRLCWDVSLTLGAIYVQGMTGEIKGVKSDIDLESLGERAIQAAKRVVEVCPESPHSYTSLASFLLMRMLLPELLDWSRLPPDEQIAKAPELEVFPMSPEMFELYEKALEVDPKDCIHISLLVSYCLTHGRYERAAELIDHAVSVEGINSREAGLYTARIERGKGNYDLAIEQFRELFGNDQVFSDHECDLIETHRLAGRFEEMLNLAEATIKQCSNTANVYCSLAKFYESQGRSEEASATHRTYCELVNENLKSLWLN